MIRSAAVAVVIMGAVAAGSAQVPSFSTNVESVRVDVLVTKDGQPVAGLGPEDFEVRDNGVLQKLDLVSDGEIPLNVVMALDMSASLDVNRIESLRLAGRSLLDGLREADQAALVSFSHLVTQTAALTSDFTRVRTAIDAMSPSGQTSLVDATFAAMLIGESSVGRPLVIVFSDGVDSTSWLHSAAVVDIAKRTDAVVYSAQVGRRRVGFLRDLTGATGGRSIEIESAKDLRATFRAILEEFRQRYLISYSPSGVTTGGWHRLEVRVRGRGLMVRARPGYQSEQ
jgi:VWFA-related protein